MRITINTEILKKHNLSLGEFLIMLIGYYDIDYQNCSSDIIEKHLAEKNLFKDTGIILSDNNKDLVAQILMESDERIIQSPIDFDALALRLQELYPKGRKPGTTYLWRGKSEEIAQKLRVIVAKYDFDFTEEEAIAAVKEYLSSFEELNQQTLILKNFLLRVSKNKDGQYEMESMFMTIIENNR